MKLSDFDFDLPHSLIAQYPSPNRTDSRLLVRNDELIDSYFSQLGSFLKPNDLSRAYSAELQVSKKPGLAIN